MPELPEVEAARAAITEHCLGKKIVRSIIADDSKVIDGVSAEEFQASLNGKTIVAAHRKGKNMWLELNSPPFPTFQFGMAGAVYIKGVAVTKYKRSAVKDDEEWPSKYSKFFVELDDGLEMSFTDKRRFAKVRLLNNPTAVPPISELGPDAFLEHMSVDEFHKLLRKKSIGIKALLLDQGFISGIGNWIADEVLYQARIHPLQSASSLSEENCKTLLNCIQEVIGKALEVGADSSQYPINWVFHSRDKKPGKAFVDGKAIEFIVAGGRTTAFVPELQKLSGAQATKKEPQKRAKKSSTSNDEAVSENPVLEAGKKASKGKKGASGKGKPKGSSKIDGDDDTDKEDHHNTEGKEPMKSVKEDDETDSKKAKSKNVSRRRKPVESDESAGDEDETKSSKIQKKAKVTEDKNVPEGSQNRRSTQNKAR